MGVATKFLQLSKVFCLLHIPTLNSGLTFEHGDNVTHSLMSTSNSCWPSIGGVIYKNVHSAVSVHMHRPYDKFFTWVDKLSDQNEI